MVVSMCLERKCHFFMNVGCADEVIITGLKDGSEAYSISWGKRILPV